MDATLYCAMLRREFEKMLKQAGASKTLRVRVATELPPHVIFALLPFWRRWRARFPR